MGRVKLNANMRDVRASLARARRVLQAEMTERLERVEQETTGMLVLGLNATIYNTEPGARPRTGDLLRGAHVQAFKRTGRYGVNVWNDEPYAKVVEYGSYGEGVSLTQAQEIAGTPGASPRPIVTGRSGVEWQSPSLAHTRATVFALFRLRQEFRAALKRVFR